MAMCLLTLKNKGLITIKFVDVNITVKKHRLKAKELKDT